MTILFTVMAAVLAVSAYTFLILKHDPALVNLGERLWPASMEHPLGTDHLGRDVLTRLLLGAQLTVGYGLLSLFAAVIIGVPFGVIAGFKGGLIDRTFMRIADAFLAFPDTIVAIVLSGLLGHNRKSPVGNRSSEMGELCPACAKYGDHRTSEGLCHCC